jgi:adenylate kinase
MKLTPRSNVVVTGKSGAGKQPRIDVLVQEFGLEQLSTGNIFRHYLGLFDAIAYPSDLNDFHLERTGEFLPDEKIEEILSPLLGNIPHDISDLILGLKAKYFVEKGLFVPDDLVNDLLRASFAKNGFQGTVLDGYPRTINQSEYLLGMMREVKSRLDLVLVVDNDDDLIIKRTMGRRICPSCGKVYHVEFKPPGVDGTCTACGTAVILRSDDSQEKIRQRLEEFRTKGVAAIQFLRQAGIPVAHVNGNLEVFTPENVRKSVLDAIG